MRKKVISLLVAVMAAALMATGLTSCGQKREAPVQSTQPTQTLEEYFASKETQEKLAELEKDLESEGDVDATIYAMDDVVLLNMHFQKITLMTDRWEEAKPQLTSFIEESEKEYKDLLKQLQSNCTNEIALVVTYTDATGLDFVSAAYTSTGDPVIAFPGESTGNMTLEEYIQEIGKLIGTHCTNGHIELWFGTLASDGSNLTQNVYIITNS